MIFIVWTTTNYLTTTLSSTDWFSPSSWQKIIRSLTIMNWLFKFEITKENQEIATSTANQKNTYVFVDGVVSFVFFFVAPLAELKWFIFDKNKYIYKTMK